MVTTVIQGSSIPVNFRIRNLYVTYFQVGNIKQETEILPQYHNTIMEKENDSSAFSGRKVT